MRALPVSMLVACLPLLAGCAHDVETVHSAMFHAADAPPAAWHDAYRVPADRVWTPTNMLVRAGEPITLTAVGAIRAQGTDDDGADDRHSFGPEGTFLYDDDEVHRPFPLPSTADGPAPCYGLVARIGDGPPIPVGRHRSWISDRSGPLVLGVNDHDPADNAGEFHVRVVLGGAPDPLAFEQVVDAGAAGGRPVPGAAVIVFYVDGLRPDVVREMAALGHLPNIRRLFLDQGVWFEHAFTAFPSDTITSNGTMWTGVFSDRHGLKGQVRFSRRTLQSDSYLEPLGPSRSAQLLGPTGIDRFLHDSKVQSVRLVAGEEHAARYDVAHTTRAAPLYERLRARGDDWATGILPVMTETPPLLWTKSMARHLPYLQSQEAWQFVDDANALFARRHLIDREAPVTVVWLPETDSVSHKRSRGQFGLTRRTIAIADQYIGEIVDEIVARGRLETTYFVLVSDHGHHGGQASHLAHFDLANEVLFAPRELDEDGRWIGGGLGFSVRQHRFWNRHPDDSGRNFAFVDGESDGAARVFLPRNGYASGDWSGPGDPAALLAYPVAEHLPPVNLVETLLAPVARHGSSGRVERPVDLVMLKLDDDAILIATGDRGFAAIDRTRAPNGRWLLRYRVVENLRPRPDGRIAFDVVRSPAIDPLRLLESLPADVIGRHHDERTWLRLTANTPYPDAVVTLTRHLLWDPTIADREREFAPDLVVTAAAGWYFGRESSPGTMHGYPFADAMRASLFVSGPNVRRGARMTDPARLVDLTPTLLDMVGIPVDEREFDGRPLRTIYETGDRTGVLRASPVYWSDVDLHAWSGLPYHPIAPYEHLPVEVNRPASPYDLNNIAYNVMTITDWNVLRLLDDAFSPLNGGEQPTTREVEDRELRLRARGGWVGEGISALNPAEATISDYTWTSVGNLKRIDGFVDWLQQRDLAADRALAEPLGREHLPGTEIVHGGIDGLQEGVWEAYRLTQRLVAQIVDETILNGLEDGTARTINSFHRVPAEVRVASHEVRAQSPEDELAEIEAPADDHPLSAKEREELRTRLEKEVAEATGRVERAPRSVSAYSARGDAYFFLGQFEKALADYETMVELDPKLGDAHWRRGIARFYAGKHAAAAEQFEAYHSFDDVDRENGIWRYLSQHRAQGRDKAREGLLKYEKTDREPFPDVFELFAGTIEPAAILKRIDEAEITDTERTSRRFYAHLYIGLNHAVEGRDVKALEHLRQATANDWAPTAGFGPTWMWHVARVHHDLLRAKRAAAPAAGRPREP